MHTPWRCPCDLHSAIAISFWDLASEALLPGDRQRKLSSCCSPVCLIFNDKSLNYQIVSITPPRNRILLMKLVAWERNRSINFSLVVSFWAVAGAVWLNCWYLIKSLSGLTLQSNHCCPGRSAAGDTAHGGRAEKQTLQTAGKAHSHFSGRNKYAFKNIIQGLKRLNTRESEKLKKSAMVVQSQSTVFPWILL